MLNRKVGDVGHARIDLDAGPSDKWFKKFKKKHLELSWSILQMVDKYRLDVADERKIDSFFNLLGTLTEHGWFSQLLHLASTSSWLNH